MLIFPGLVLPYGALFLGTCRMCREFSSGELGERIIVIGGIVQFAVFDLMTAYFLYTSFRQVEILAFMPLDLNQLLCGVSGLGLIALGNWIPKLKEPGPVGGSAAGPSRRRGRAASWPPCWWRACGAAYGWFWPSQPPASPGPSTPGMRPRPPRRDKKAPLPQAGEGRFAYHSYSMPLKSNLSSQALAVSHTPRRHASPKGLSSPAFSSRPVKVRLPPCFV